MAKKPKYQTLEEMEADGFVTAYGDAAVCMRLLLTITRKLRERGFSFDACMDAMNVCAALTSPNRHNPTEEPK